jgi:hypothetical protein
MDPCAACEVTIEEATTLGSLKRALDRESRRATSPAEAEALRERFACRVAEIRAASKERCLTACEWGVSSARHCGHAHRQPPPAGERPSL